MNITLLLRDVTESDLPIFFEQQRDPVAINMAGFTAKDPADRDAFTAKWARILADESIVKKAIVVEGRVVGNVLCFVAPWSGQQEVSYWLGREFWSKGIATQALQSLLRSVTVRPLYARAATDNVASIRVLEKCDFTLSGDGRGFANARGVEIDEIIMELKMTVPLDMTLDRDADWSET